MNIVNIRKGFFETSSSSMHSYSIADSGNLVNDLPNPVVFDEGDFGWEYYGDAKPVLNDKGRFCRFIDSYTKLQYLITYFAEKEEHWEENKFSVNKNHKDYDLFEKLKDAVREFSGSEIQIEKGEYYIDHQSYELPIEILSLNPGKLKRWIFNPLSYLDITNDN